MIDLFTWDKPSFDPNRPVRLAAYQREKEQLERARKELDRAITEFDTTMNVIKHCGDSPSANS